MSTSSTALKLNPFFPIRQPTGQFSVLGTIGGEGFKLFQTPTININLIGACTEAEAEVVGVARYSDPEVYSQSARSEFMSSSCPFPFRPYVCRSVNILRTVVVSPELLAVSLYHNADHGRISNEKWHEMLSKYVGNFFNLPSDRKLLRWR